MVTSCLVGNLIFLSIVAMHFMEEMICYLFTCVGIPEVSGCVPAQKKPRVYLPCVKGSGQSDASPRTANLLLSVNN